MAYQPSEQGRCLLSRVLGICEINASKSATGFFFFYIDFFFQFSNFRQNITKCQLVEILAIFFVSTCICVTTDRQNLTTEWRDSKLGEGARQ